jgi:UMF1 family MFS transporter
MSAGVWWGGFSIVTFAVLKNRKPTRALRPGQSYFGVGLFELGSTFRQLARLPFTLKYLVGYLFYNDGVQTVLAMASVFMSQELFTPEQRNAGDDQTFILEIFLMVQFVAFFGSLIFEKVAAALGAKRAILISLVLWCGIVIYAYGFLHTTYGAWGMAAVLAMIMGGSQALSRSLFARMVPAGYEASFFGIYEISEKGTSWMGQLLFGVVVGITGSYRQAILSLIALFLIGTTILALTDTDRAIKEAAASPLL